MLSHKYTGHSPICSTIYFCTAAPCRANDRHTVIEKSWAVFQLNRDALSIETEWPKPHNFFNKIVGKFTDARPSKFLNNPRLVGIISVLSLGLFVAISIYQHCGTHNPSTQKIGFGRQVPKILLRWTKGFERSEIILSKSFQCWHGRRGAKNISDAKPRGRQNIAQTLRSPNISK